MYQSTLAVWGVFVMLLRFPFASCFTLQILSLSSSYSFSSYTSVPLVNHSCVFKTVSVTWAFLCQFPSVLSSGQYCVPSISCVSVFLLCSLWPQVCNSFSLVFTWTFLCLPFVASILNTGLWIFKYGHQVISKAHFFLFYLPAVGSLFDKLLTALLTTFKHLADWMHCTKARAATSKYVKQ